MVYRVFEALLIMAVLQVFTSSVAIARPQRPIDCLHPNGPADTKECNQPLADITYGSSGNIALVKLQCYGCPTVERSELGRGHRITHEENALFLNITLSHSHKELLLNDNPIFPTFSPIHSFIYATQVPLNFSIASLASTLDCLRQPCNDGSCPCIANALGAYALGLDYVAVPLSQGNEWTVKLDAIEGQNGYIEDPIVQFNATEQRVLSIKIKQVDDEGNLEIVSVELVKRGDTRVHGKFTMWEKVLKFFGIEKEIEEKENEKWPEHVVHRLPDWKKDDGSQWGRILISTMGALGVLLILCSIFILTFKVHRPLHIHDGLKSIKVTFDEDKGDEREALLAGEDGKDECG